MEEGICSWLVRGFFLPKPSHKKRGRREGEKTSFDPLFSVFFCASPPSREEKEKKDEEGEEENTHIPKKHPNKTSKPRSKRGEKIKDNLSSRTFPISFAGNHSLWRYLHPYPGHPGWGEGGTVVAYAGELLNVCEKLQNDRILVFCQEKACLIVFCMICVPAYSG